MATNFYLITGMVNARCDLPMAAALSVRTLATGEIEAERLAQLRTLGGRPAMLGRSSL